MRIRRLTWKGAGTLAAIGLWLACASPAASAAAPTVDGESASGVTVAGAVLEAQIDPNEEETTYSFQYADNEALVDATSVAGASQLTGSGEQPASVSISGLAADTTYYYRVLAENVDHETTQGAVQHFTTVGPPVVDDRPPTVSSVTRTSALVAATIDPSGGASRLQVEYVSAAEFAAGAANPYAGGASSQSLVTGAGRVDETVERIPLTGLRAGTTYHYRLVASNQAGTVSGPDYVFTTAAPTPPLVTTGEASAVTQTGATVSGTVGPQALQTSYELDLGTDTSYGGAKIFGSAGASAGSEAVVVGLQDLVPGTTYHYRLVAINQDGTSFGADRTFTTPPAETSIAQPLALALLGTPAIPIPTESGGSAVTHKKSLTRAQQLATALKACKRRPGKQRSVCSRRARRRYGSQKQRKGKRG